MEKACFFHNQSRQTIKLKNGSSDHPNMYSIIGDNIITTENKAQSGTPREGLFFFSALETKTLHQSSLVND